MRLTSVPASDPHRQWSLRSSEGRERENPERLQLFGLVAANGGDAAQVIDGVPAFVADVLEITQAAMRDGVGIRRCAVRGECA